jgi:excisionase family DNA binding protein
MATDQTNEDPYLTPLQIAEQMGVSDQTVYDWIRSGKLPATKVQRLLRIRRSDLQRMLEAHRTTTASNDENAFWEDPEAQDFQLPGRAN